MAYHRTDILLVLNFFFLALALLVVYYYAYRLRFELKRSDQRRKLAEKYRALFNSTSDGVFQCDSEGYVLVINTAGAKILGFDTPEEMTRRKVKIGSFCVNPEDRRRLIEQLRKNGQVQNFVLKVKRNNGELFFAEATLNFLSIEGGKGIQGIFRDVTKRVHLEEELRNYSENLEQKVQEKTEEILALERKKAHLEKLAALGEMAATIVHEIRNPLSSIKIGLTALISRLPLEEKDKKCLEVAKKEVINLEKILKNLLNFARPEDLQLIEQDINAVLNFVLDQLMEDFRTTGISIEKELAMDLPHIKIDMNRLSQVFINILLNAREALDNNGTIVVRSKNMSEKKKIRIEIADTGKGIEKEDLQRIFDPFFSKKDGGTGLGLAIVQKIVEAHGGIVGVDSQLETGTTVWIELPVSEKYSIS